MKLEDFHFDLPESQIASHPLPERSSSRLLQLGRHDGSLRDLRFHELPTLLEPEDLLVFNDTRVIPARVFARKATGGRLELLVERVLPGNRLLAQLRPSRGLVAGTRFVVPDADGTEVEATVVSEEDGFRVLAFPESLDLIGLFDRVGHMPLPPYIKRQDEEEDRERYQTVYARRSGAVAAPTAGLHFDAALLEALLKKGIASTTVTLHVGAGTFQPIRVADITQHRMHAEHVEVSEEACAAVAACRERGGRVVAVGTTSVRCLETAAASGELRPYRGDTRIFIYPGHEFRCVDALVTNFHLPESTLLMLVSAFAGREPVLAAYRHAVAAGYRFFSYGDAMFIA